MFNHKKYNGSYNNRRSSTEFQEKLIIELYRKLDISKYRYKILEYEYELPLLTNEPHLVAPNFAGKRVLLIFFKIMGRFMSYMIEKDTLKYNYEKLRIEDVRLSRLNIRVKPNAFNGTIFDAFFIHDKHNNQDVLMINDAYFVAGKDLTNTKMIHKSLYIKSFWEEMVTDATTDNIKIMNNMYCETSQLNKLYNTIIPNHPLSYLIRGFAFVPEISGQKIIYLFNNVEQKTTETLPQLTTNKIEKIKEELNKKLEQEEDIDEIKYDVPQSVILNANFQMRKTDTVDLYHLYLPKIIKDNSGTLKAIMTYYDVAYVNGFDGSKFCKKLLKSNDKVLVSCKFNAYHAKWEPIKDVSNKIKYPDKFRKVKNMLKKYIN